jgi:hypothetical protein
MKKTLIAACAVFASAIAAHAQVFTCTLTPKRGYTGVTPTQMQIDLNARPGALVISDNVGPKIGLPTINGEIDRYVGNDLLFRWQLSSIPLALKPPTETKFYRSTVNYTGRLNQTTGAIRIVGNFVTSVSSANTGLNMRAEGSCK